MVRAVSGPSPFWSTSSGGTRTIWPGSHARVGLGAAAVDADLAGAQQLLKLPEAEARKMRLEPAVEPHARLVGFNLDLFYACHFISPFRPRQYRLAPSSCAEPGKLTPTAPASRNASL